MVQGDLADCRVTPEHWAEHFGRGVGISMIRTVEALIDERGAVQVLEDIRLAEPRRALVVILEEGPAAFPHETAVLSEPALAVDWNRPEEDAAWLHLQPGQ